MESAGAALKSVATGTITKEQVAAMKPKDQVKHYLTANKSQIEAAVPKHMQADRLLQVATSAILSTPKLLECYLPTLIGGVIQCAQMGLEPNTVLGHAYLVPFNNSKKKRKDVQVIIGYKGFIDLARRSGHIVSIAAHAVYENDKFKYEYGLNEELRHIPGDGDRGKITHFYAVAHMKDGGHAFEVLTKGAVDRIRATTNGKDNQVWDKHYEEMGRKTAIRRLSKYLPLSVELATAVAMDDAAAAGNQGDLSSVLDGEYHITEDDDGDPRDSEASRNDSDLFKKNEGDPAKKETIDKGTGEIKNAGGDASPTEAQKILNSMGKATSIDTLDVAYDARRDSSTQYTASELAAFDQLYVDRRAELTKAPTKKK